MKLRTRRILWPAACVALLVLTGVMAFRNIHLSRQVDLLHTQLTAYQEKEGKSYVVERISKQMEDIAYQQKDISEKQREEAVFQMGVAKEMRLRAEEEQQRAEEAAHHAAEARNMAEKQRELAVQQQRQAEHARNVADTLSHVALGRALAMLSNVQYRAGNKEVAALLAYAAWQYTSEYKGNIYQPAIFSALGQTSESFITRNLHQGGITQIVPRSKNGHSYVSASNYGEIRSWKYEGGFSDNQLLFSNPDFSFRDLYVDAGDKIYALSYTGEMLIGDGGGAWQTIILPEKDGWKRVIPWGEKQLLLTSTSGICIYDKERKRIVKDTSLPEPLTALGEKSGQWLAFGKAGGVWAISSSGELLPQKSWTREPVTAFTWSDELNRGAIGVEGGNIYLVDARGNILNDLVGHRSRITQLEFKGRYLFSSSYDCTINLWDVLADKKEAVSLKTLSSWAHCFYISDENTLFTGDETGAMSRIMISPNEMAALIQRQLKRDFTDEEWAYYVGRNVPRRRMKLAD